MCWCSVSSSARRPPSGRASTNSNTCSKVKSYDTVSRSKPRPKNSFAVKGFATFSEKSPCSLKPDPERRKKSIAPRFRTNTPSGSAFSISRKKPCSPAF
jgi:hypothetical protein